MPTLIAIDGNSLLFRAFHALPILTDAKGRYTNAVYGFMGMLIRLIQEEKPDYLAVAFDLKAPTFRHLQYKGYKAGRKAGGTQVRGTLQALSGRCGGLF